jgi:methionyl aminopeptidase
VIVRKSEREIEQMARAGAVVARTLELLGEHVRPGVTTHELDRVAEELIRSHGGEPTFKGYRGYPAAICTSPNDVIVHGIPGDYRLKEGDIISIDCGAIIEGYHADAAVTVPVGKVSDEAQRLVDVTRRSLEAGIKKVRDGGRLFDIGAAVQDVAEGAGFSVVREYVGHGIGTAMHEEPKIPNYRPSGRTNMSNMKLRVGHVLAVEPMVNAGGPATQLCDDGWTVLTADGRLSAHFEHTIAVTDNGPEVLTVPG